MRPYVNETTESPFLMLRHGQSNSNKDRFKLLSKALIRQPLEGLSNINSEIVNKKFLPTFIHLSVNV
jgi:hypothetical protein